MTNQKISQLTAWTPLDTDIIPYVDLVTGETKKALKSDLEWADWTAATISVWTTTTWAEWTSASVVNTGTTSAAVFDFTIPVWDTGATGATWATGATGADGTSITWLWAYSWGTSYVVNDAVEYDWSSYICILASTWNLPTNATYFELMAEKWDNWTGDMTKATYDPQGIEDDAFDRANHTGTQLASTISDFDTQVAGNTDVTENTANRNLLKVSSNDTTANYLESKLVAGTNVTLTTVNEWADEVINISASWSWDTINYYNTYKAPQLFNPDASWVTANSDVFTLSSSAEVWFVTINWQTIDDSEYSLSWSDLTVTPDNWFNSTADEVLVFQTKITATWIDLGWGYYQDNTYTEWSPLAINSARVQIPINWLGTNTETGYLPASWDLWNTTDNKIMMDSIWDSFTFRLDWKAKAGSNNSYYDIELDIWDGSSIVILKNTLTIVKGINVEQSFSRTFSWFALATFITNWGKIYLNSTDDGVNLSVYDLAIHIQKTN